jgi:hypothetical protein
MGCQSEVYIGDYLTFSICTHDPDTGVLTDATGSPAYRIYEDETATAVATGSMAKLDDANTTGFYTERVECAATTYDVGKSYNIYITATVDSDEGGIAYTFKTNALTAVQAANLAASAGTIGVGTVSHDNTAATTTVFYSDDIATAAADHWTDRIVIFTSGTLLKQMVGITAYAKVGGEGQFTVTDMTSEPADNVTFVIV